MICEAAKCWRRCGCALKLALGQCEPAWSGTWGGLVPVWTPQFPAIVTQRGCRVYRLLYQCHQVLYNQIIAWMVHGTLIDTGSEFFVQLADGHRWSKRGADKAAVSSAALSATLASSKADAEAAEHDWNTRYVCVCLYY